MSTSAEGGSVHRVLDFLLAQEEPVSRPEVADACLLSRPTVFAAVQQLEDRGLVRSAGVRSGALGRSAALYEIAPDAGSLLAVDIGGSYLRAALTDLRGVPVAEREALTGTPGGAAIVAQALALVAETLAAADGSAPRRLVQVAVSVPGVVHPDGRTVSYASNIDQDEPFDFGTPFVEALAVPVTLENNVNLAALAEGPTVPVDDASPYVVVSVGAGIGAGIVHRGTLLRGAHGAAGEVAFLPGPPSEARSSTAHDAAGGLSLLEAARLEDSWRGEAPATVEELFARADRGEDPAPRLVEEECRRIVGILAAICAVVNPSTVIPTGGVGTNARLLDRVGALTAETLPFPPALVGSRLGKRASLLGAIHLAAQRAGRRLRDSLAD
jgi:glucokinase